MPATALSRHATIPLASAHDLHFSYGSIPVFVGLSFAIYPGLTLVHGGEGCGKSTLLRLLAGVITAHKGSLDWSVLDTAQAGASAPQGSVYWIDPRDDQHNAIPARAYLALLQARHPDFSHQDLDTLVQDLGLTDQLDKSLYMLSTGSKRKVWLAGAFASRCRLTLLEEPFAALDQRSVNSVKAWLNRVAQDTDRALVVADYAAPPGVLVGHSVSLDGAPAQI